MSLKELQFLIDEYDKSLELKLEADKKERKAIKDLHLDIDKGLKELRGHAHTLPDRDYNKVYAQVYDGEKWI